ncbi:hypothetical protein G3I37_10760, partial [Streptomyces anulatus]|nr:hypothetical protein [Streptomyces anulatus]
MTTTTTTDPGAMVPGVPAHGASDPGAMVPGAWANGATDPTDPTGETMERTTAQAPGTAWPTAPHAPDAERLRRWRMVLGA